MIVAVQGDQVWPWDGEYWEDEVEHYREKARALDLPEAAREEFDRLSRPNRFPTEERM